MIDVLEHSTCMKQTATRILLESQIIATLERYCTPQLTGSYVLDLMIDPDIDIVVVTDHPKGVSRAVLDDVLDQEFFQRYEYGDFVRFQHRSRPTGYILVLAITVDTMYWEIEVWFVVERPSQEVELIAYVQQHLTPETRKYILDAKHERYASGKGKSNITSVDIYYGVLRDNARTLDQIEQDLAKRRLSVS